MAAHMAQGSTVVYRVQVPQVGGAEVHVRGARQHGFGMVDGADVALLQEDGLMVRAHQDRPEGVVAHGHRPGGDGVGPAQVAEDLLVGRGGAGESAMGIPPEI